MALAVLAVPVPAASAATLTVANGAATYEAGAEANRVQFRYDGAAATVALTDLASSLLTAPDGCTRTATATDATVTCPAAGLTTVVIRAGDGPDSVAASASASAPPPFGLQVALGPGDDRLDVLAGVAIAVRGEGGNGRDLLNGGDGGDLLTGGAGDDTLVGGVSADVLQGGAGQDTVSYRERTGSVQVSIGSATPDDGEAGEGDDVQGDVEQVRGGWADDRLVGNSEDNLLSGGDGDDELLGAGGRDELSGGDGEDRLDAQLDDDESEDRLRCGGGLDLALSNPEDLVSSSCERR